MYRIRPLACLMTIGITLGLLAACAGDATSPTGPGPDTAGATGHGGGGSVPDTVVTAPADTSVADTSGAGTADTAGVADSSANGIGQAALLVCTPQPHLMKSAWIGPKGGEIKVGKSEFKVPSGALDVSTLITMELPADSVRSVRFSPEGLTFKSGRWPELKLDYAGCPKPKKNKGKGGGGDKVKVAYVTEQLEILQVLPSADDSVNTDVQAKLKHFSRYAITY
jgi:hypothetical protein